MDWAVTGINYQKANLSQRQRYALDEAQIIQAYDLLQEIGIQHTLIISTCNRTEFFTPIEHKKKAIEIISKEIYEGAIDDSLFHDMYGDDATSYFFRICSGLESQIAGDFEILGQVRRAASIAKKRGLLSGTWERTINNAIGAAKRARTHTGYYSGASSTSYASIEYLKNSNINLKRKKYLIIGTGKIGGHTIDHLLKFVKAENITITNRTMSRAIELSSAKNLRLLPFENIKSQAQDYDVIICATNAPDFLLDVGDFQVQKSHHIIDLSVPMNVNPELGNSTHIDLVNVDELSAIVNKNMLKRASEKKNVEKIVEEGIADLNAWFTIKTGMPMLAELKEELEKIKREALSNVEINDEGHSEEFLDNYTDELFNQLSQQWIKKVRNMAVNAD